jgi:hypothetical protein
VPHKESQQIPALQPAAFANRFSRLAKSPDGHLGRRGQPDIRQGFQVIKLIQIGIILITETRARD